MPDPSQRQALADAIRGELLAAHHGTTDLDALVDRVLDCVDTHQPVPEVSLRQLSYVVQLEQRVAVLAESSRRADTAEAALAELLTFVAHELDPYPAYWPDHFFAVEAHRALAKRLAGHPQHPRVTT